MTKLGMSRCSSLVVVLLLGSLSWADPAPSPMPAPDPSQGERSDGRISGPPSYKDAAALVPRILLLPLRLLMKGLSYPAEAMARQDEKYRIRAHLYHIFTSDDGARGVRPEITYSFTFAPMFGLSYFDKKFLGERT